MNPLPRRFRAFSPTSCLRACVPSFLILLTACTHPIAITGKVIPGPISFIGTVDPADPRLNQPGLAGAALSARGSQSYSDQILADTRSGQTGNFTLLISDQVALRRPAEFHARLPGYADAAQEMTIPPKDRRLLVVLKPIAPGGQ